MQYVRVIDHATSVKQISVLEEPTSSAPGRADFTFRPVFSVFDYGTIDPPVPLDNRTICLMAAFNFELLWDEHIPSHYGALVDGDGPTMTARLAISRGIASDTMRLRFVNRMMPDFVDGRWDYAKFHRPPVNNYVQPIEFISRNELPESASLWKRIRRGEVTLAQLGLPADFCPGMPIPDAPLLDYSTKFEKGDRPLTPAEAKGLMGISDERFAAINDTTRRASRLMTVYAASRGFKRLDGKVEYVVVTEGDRVADVLGDAVCTWHEDRISYHGVGISKQRIRDKVIQLNTAWYDEIQRAKAVALEQGVKDFRALMDPGIAYVSPSAEFFNGVNTLFRAATNQWVGARVFSVHIGKTDSLEDSLERAIEEFQHVV